MADRWSEGVMTLSREVLIVDMISIVTTNIKKSAELIVVKKFL